jgi:hypothetical protein
MQSLRVIGITNSCGFSMSLLCAFSRICSLKNSVLASNNCFHLTPRNSAPQVKQMIGGRSAPSFWHRFQEERMACNNDCVYLGSQVRAGYGRMPVCGYVPGPASWIEPSRPICGNYKQKGAKNTEQSTHHSASSRDME